MNNHAQREYDHHTAWDLGVSHLGYGLESIALAAKGEDIGTAPGMDANIETHHFHGGSGPGSFGGVCEWPAILVRVSFPALTEQKRDALADELAKFLEERGFTIHRKDRS